MSYDSAIIELRQLLSDTEYNKKVTKKAVIGSIDGENTNFITYDKRIYEDSLEVFVTPAGEPESAVSFNLDDRIKGTIVLSEAPPINSAVTASYYYQFWIDDELKNFLNKGAELTSQWTSTVPDNAFLQILPGLKTPALMFAASLATRAFIQFLVNRRHSSEFLLEQDGNDDANFSQTISALQTVADSYWKDATKSRDDFYMRQGKRNAPAFAVKQGITRRYGPIR